MHRVVGDRTHALVGAFTVAGLCWDLTRLRDQTVGVTTAATGRPIVRWRALAHAPWGALAPVLRRLRLGRPRGRKAIQPPQSNQISLR